MPFIGLQIPVMARMRFKPQPNREKSIIARKVEPSMVWGVFTEWSTHPGGKWNGRYKCVDLREFADMDSRVGKSARAQGVFEVQFDPGEPVCFPLKGFYDAAMGALEGLRAPRDSPGELPPQGVSRACLMIFLLMICNPSVLL